MVTSLPDCLVNSTPQLPPQVDLQAPCWTVFLYLLIIYKPEGLLEGYKRRIFILTLILYPPAEFALKLLASLASLAVNMAEHFTAGLVVSVYLSTLLHGTLRKLGHWERLVFTVSVAVFLCLLYEITGFLIYYEPTAALYSDTMRDLSMNMAGAVMAATCYLTTRQNQEYRGCNAGWNQQLSLGSYHGNDGGMGSGPGPGPELLFTGGLSEALPASVLPLTSLVSWAEFRLLLWKYDL